MKMHHYEPESCENALLSSRSRSQCGGHIIVSTTSSALVIPLQPNLMGHHHKPDCLVKKKRIALFKIKFIMTAQQITEYLSIL